MQSTTSYAEGIFQRRNGQFSSSRRVKSFITEAAIKTRRNDPLDVLNLAGGTAECLARPYGYRFGPSRPIKDRLSYDLRDPARRIRRK